MQLADDEWYSVLCFLEDGVLMTTTRLVCISWRNLVDTRILQFRNYSIIPYARAMGIFENTTLGHRHLFKAFFLPKQKWYSRNPGRNHMFEGRNGTYVDTASCLPWQCVAFTKKGFKCRNRFQRQTRLCRTHHEMLPGSQVLEHQ